MKVIFSGSSNSCSYNNNNEYLWNTWKHIVIKNYQLENYTDLTYYGQGNEAICTRALLEMHKEVNCILFLQVTPVDKWDWLLPNNMIEKLKNDVSNIHKELKEKATEMKESVLGCLKKNLLREG